MAKSRGSRIGSYEILGLIGVGGMGEVYRARDTRLGRDVAIKFLPDELTQDADRRARFEREARHLASLNHANIAAIYGLEEAADGASGLVLELVEGPTLAERLQGGALPVPEALRVAAQMAAALANAHEAGIVHRDLKPANVKLKANGDVKVLDFGLAKTLARGLQVGGSSPLPTVTTGGTTRAGTMLGTPAYMSPEQTRGNEVDRRADVWAFGCVLYELLTGRPAFPGNSVPDTIAAVLRSEPDWGQLPDELPPGVTTLLRRCLEKDPARRLRDLGDAGILIEESSAGAVGERTGERTEKSIAVLPFANLSATSDQEYFSDGLAEELINALAHLPGLRVASRSSTFRFRAHALDVRDVGKQLNVDTVLEGSVRRHGNRLRITVQLINVADGYHLWSERYDRELADVFAIQDEITQSVVEKLEPRLRNQSRSPRRHTENPEAFEVYLRGRHFWYQRTEASLRAGINCFMTAISMDPDYALAHAGLADSFSVMRPWCYVGAAEAKERAERAAMRALELDPMLAEAQYSMALYKQWFTEDWFEAEPYFEKAIALHPRASVAIVQHANFLAVRQRFDESIRGTERAIALDPLSPIVYGIGAASMHACRRYDRAVELARRALELYPGFAIALYALGVASSQTGDCDGAVEACSRLVEITNRASVAIGMLGNAYATAGRTSEARLLLDELAERSSRQYVDPLCPILTYAGLRDWDNVADQLEALIRVRGPFANVACLLSPYLGELAVQPRFQRLFRRLRLPIGPN
jgi:serine/threonine-protein kinase